MNHRDLIEQEIERILADKEAEIAHLRREKSDCHKVNDIVVQQRNEAQALVAMKDEALGAIASPENHLNVWSRYAPRMSDKAVIIEIAKKAISASAESVAAWKAELLKPLQQQVAMLRERLHDCAAKLESQLMRDALPLSYREIVASAFEAINDTQATAEEYDKEVAAKAFEAEALLAIENIDGSDAKDEAHNAWLYAYARQLQKLADEIRAGKKGGAE